jgi:hypothetical protein
LCATGTEREHEPTELAPYAQWFPRQTKEAILARVCLQNHDSGTLGAWHEEI